MVFSIWSIWSLLHTNLQCTLAFKNLLTSRELKADVSELIVGLRCTLFDRETHMRWEVTHVGHTRWRKKCLLGPDTGQQVLSVGHWSIRSTRAPHESLSKEILHSRNEMNNLDSEDSRHYCTNLSTQYFFI